MDAEHVSIARSCLHAAHDGSLSFPEIIAELTAAGFEGFTVDFRRNAQTYYRPDGDSALFDMPGTRGAVAAIFDAEGVESLVRWAQANGPDYTYKVFCEKVRACGCAGYLVSFPDRRVVYFGRSAQTHVEHFPQ